jgi:ATP-dependent Lon protease
MQTGRISLDVFRECRGAFTVEEWLDLIVRTLGYEPSMYAETEKLWMLCRLIPLVQNRINLMELAPPGSGKSYLYVSFPQTCAWQKNRRGGASDR